MTDQTSPQSPVLVLPDGRPSHFIERATAGPDPKPPSPSSVSGKQPDPNRLPPGISTVGPFFLRKHWYPQSPFGVSADMWRNIAARAPIVALCRRTLILEVTAIPWKVVADDPKEVEYYTDLLANANNETWDSFIERLLEDILTVPFGGAVEPTYYRDGALAGVYHVDGGTMYPTYDPKAPYIQIDPDDSMRRTVFEPDQLERIMWAPIPDIRNYGWSKPPVMDVFTAVQALMRSDEFYGQFLSNTPEAGILDLGDMHEEQARQWVQSWQELMLGIDPLKVPVLYEHQKDAKYITFARSPAEIAMPEIVKRYAELCVAAHGMSIGDLGIYEHQNTLAGASRMAALSKRQGLGSLMRKVQHLINVILRDSSAHFEWDPLDEEDRLRKAQANKSKADTLKILATADPGSGQPIFPLSVIRKQAIMDGLIDVINLDDVDTSKIDEMIAEEAEKAKEAEAEAEEDQPPLEEQQPVGPEEIPEEEEETEERSLQIETRADITEFPEDAPFAQDFSTVVDQGLDATRKKISHTRIQDIVERLQEHLLVAEDRSVALHDDEDQHGDDTP